jgi:hypothetical protein
VKAQCNRLFLGPLKFDFERIFGDLQERYGIAFGHRRLLRNQRQGRKDMRVGVARRQQLGILKECGDDVNKYVNE